MNVILWRLEVDGGFGHSMLYVGTELEAELRRSMKAGLEPAAVRKKRLNVVGPAYARQHARSGPFSLTSKYTMAEMLSGSVR